MIAQIELTCKVCDKKFLRNKSEHNRNQKFGRKVYCSRSCCGKDNFDNIPEDKRYHPENLKGRDVDDYSPFRYILRRITLHKKYTNFDIYYLKELFDKQNGICPYTGWKMKLPISVSQHNEININNASIDRMDSSKGYTKDNIEFISLIAQYAKNTFTKNDVLHFCQSVICHQEQNIILTKEDHEHSLSAFKLLLNIIRKHCKNKINKTCQINAFDLQELWEKQSGVCPYTGWQLKINPTCKYVLPITPDRGTIDRIDSSKGYTKDNIEFVSLIAQYGKNVFSKEDVFYFCQSVVEYQKTNANQNLISVC